MRIVYPYCEARITKPQVCLYPDIPRRLFLCGHISPSASEGTIGFQSLVEDFKMTSGVLQFVATIY